MSRKLHADSPASGPLMGTNGAIIATDTNEKTGPFFAICALTDTEIDSATLDSTLITGNIDGLTIYAGSTIILYGINAITLASGTAILYKM